MAVLSNSALPRQRNHVHAEFAAFAETARVGSVIETYQRYLAARAVIDEPDDHASDAAMEGMLAAETRALTDLCLTPARSTREAGIKMQALIDTLAREEHLPATTLMLAAALQTDLNRLSRS